MPARIPMTERQRRALLALPTTEEDVVRYHSLDDNDLVATREARTPETRLGYALQLCCLRYPGRHLQKGELLPAIMLDHIAEQVDVDADVIGQFARRVQTRYEQLAAIKRRHGFRDLTRPVRTELADWLAGEALGLYAFAPRARYGKLAPLFGHRLDPNLIRAHWDDIGPMIEAMQNKSAAN